ncbi:hypothetical protein FRC10_001357 [Ceratobasidium sp. 414]|nr:hypothetical protein FRC10_001357 [Ceratobasidium sp. 414]
MTQTTLLEEWLNSPNPAPISLPEFKTEAHKIPVVFEARVKHVSCHRLGIHEYILVHCSVMLPTAQRPIMAHFRLERNPTEKSPRLLSGKSNPAADTIRMSVNTDMLHPKGSWAVRGYFVFNQEDNARQPLKLKHILEMYEYLSQESHKYTIFGTNCRWLCFGLLECLRDCKPCFGGQWFECGRKDSVPKQDTQAAVRAKACYLKEKHAECCNSRPRPSSIMAALVAEATNVGIAVSNMVEIANQAQVPTPTPSPTDPNVIYSTAVPATPLPQQTQLPSGNTRPVHNHVSPQHIPSGMPAFVEEPETIHNEPTMRSPHPPHPPHHHAHTQRQSVSYISSPPVLIGICPTRDLGANLQAMRSTQMHPTVAISTTSRPGAARLAHALAPNVPPGYLVQV